MANVLIAYATTEGQSAKIANHIANVLATGGHDTTVADVKQVSDLASYDAVVLGGSIHAGHYQRRLLDFAKRVHDGLVQRPTAFYTVCLAAAGKDPRAIADIQQKVAEFERAAGFEPHDETVLAGALKYRSYGLIKRFLMKTIAGRSGGETDTSQDYEYTDWSVVSAFAQHFSEHVHHVTRARNESTKGLN